VKSRESGETSIIVSREWYLKDCEAVKLRKLERELQSVKEEQDILEKALAVFPRTPQKYRFQ
jgi:transposase-like protein